MKQKEIAIVHYNTPELTEAAILSVRKHCQENYHFTIFDNSDAAIQKEDGRCEGDRQHQGRDHRL